PAAPIPIVWTNARRVSAMTLLLLLLFTGRRGRGAEHVAEYVGRLLHFVHRADRDPRVGLLEGREVAADQHVRLRARLAEILRRAVHVDEDEVALRLGRLAA